MRELKSKNAKLVEAINTGDKPTDAQNQTIVKLAKKIADSYKESKKTLNAKVEDN